MADPAFRGFVESTLDALLIFEGCKRGFLPKITRRLQEFEKRAHVVSGAVFVFDEEETGIKRWTDGLTWSPSRTLGNFLVYRELDKKAQPAGGGASNEEDDINAAEVGSGAAGGGSMRSRLMGGLTSKADPVDEQDMAALGACASGSGSRPESSSARRRSSVTEPGGGPLDRARERALVGSLTSSYRFRSDGLVKKTISLQGLHLIGYYRIDDVVSGRLRTPSSHHELNALEVSSHFLVPSLYRIPPLVELGSDGQLKYKGEADAPMSPLTRSASSQGILTPAGPQSRPASASNAPDQFGHALPPSGGQWERPLATPGSPRRNAASAYRSNNRFEPYSSTRFSPNHNYPPHSAAGYPFPPSPAGPPPSRNPFLPAGESAFEAGGQYLQERTPPVDVTSTSVPLNGGGWHGPHGGTAFSATSSGGDFGIDGLHTPGSAFYQPRLSLQYAPTSDASSSGGIFAYNPPPTAGVQGPSTQQYRAPHTATGVYSSYQTHRPYSAQQQQAHALGQARPPPSNAGPNYAPQLSPMGESHSQSPFATPPSTGHPSRAPHPVALSLPLATSGPPSQRSGSSLPSPLPPPGYAPQQRVNGSIVEPTSSLSSRATTLMAEVSPHSPADALGDSRMQREQREALRVMYGGNGGGGGYVAPPSSVAYQPYEQPRGQYIYPPPQQQHPSGLVAPVTNEEVVPASGHGLGVSAYGEIIPAAQVGTVPSSSGYALSQSSGLRPAPPGPPSALSSQQYAPQPLAPGLYDVQGQHAGAGRQQQHQHQPLSGPLAGRPERGGGAECGSWPVKRETPDPSLVKQPLSPPMQPQRSLAQPQHHPPSHQSQQGWWGGEDPWQQHSVVQRQAQDFQQV